MKRLLTFFLSVSFLISGFNGVLLEHAFAQTFQDIFNFNNPVEYDQAPQLGRGFKDPDSIDSCLQRKEFFFNEVHNIWVEGLERCKHNSKGILSRATFQGVSTDPADEQVCVGKREGAILQHGIPSEDEARRWSERCSYLGTIGGAGPIGTNSPSSNFSLFFGEDTSSTSSRTGTTTRTGTTGTTTGTSSRTDVGPSTETQIPVTERDAERYLAEQGIDISDLNESQREAAISNAMTELQQQRGGTSGPDFSELVYRGPGIQVPDSSLVAEGISRETSLIQLIVFYTNATLPYVSVLAVFVFVAAGLFYILSFTNEELHTKAKTMMLYVVIGIFIIFSAYTVVNTLLSFSSLQ